MLRCQWHSVRLLCGRLHIVLTVVQLLQRCFSTDYSAAEYVCQQTLQGCAVRSMWQHPSVINAGAAIHNKNVPDSVHRAAGFTVGISRADQAAQDRCLRNTLLRAMERKQSVKQHAPMKTIVGDSSSATLNSSRTCKHHSWPVMFGVPNIWSFLLLQLLSSHELRHAPDTPSIRAPEQRPWKVCQAFASRWTMTQGNCRQVHKFRVLCFQGLLTWQEIDHKSLSAPVLVHRQGTSV